ncbi:MAG: phage virion morphogenesis protein [Syntrophus sp. (in: bacteria)]|jgi:phage virion morphogenesis protein|nr:phage virion morphogenesis protein [Syntrophus sp. (in: bacteria)]
MPVQLEMKIEDREVAILLQGLERRIEDRRPAMREIGEIIRESCMRNFREQRGPGGERWKPSRRAASQGGKTLIDTAVLRNSIHVDAMSDQVRVGTPVEYAGVHQFGAAAGSFGTRVVNVRSHTRGGWGGGVPSYVSAHRRVVKLPWGDIPARPFLGIRDEDWPEIKDALLDYIIGG